VFPHDIGLHLKQPGSGFFGFQYRKESMLGQFHIPNEFHPFLSLFLLFKELALTGDVPAVTLGQHILTQGIDRLPGDDWAPKGPLYGDFELL
jgi:hypothetical protein